jgi:GTP-binding protein HflX
MLPVRGGGAGGVCRAILAGIQTDGDIGRSMDELAALAEAAGAEVVGHIVQSREKPDGASYLGRGKVEELREFCENMGADAVICNDEISGVQLRNLEERTGVGVIDRTMLIMDIFAARAASKEGKLQVELAQLQYRLPRLAGLGKSLSRLGGGIGTRGPGEKKLETDRRHISRRMYDIKSELREAEAHRNLRRARRKKNGVPVVALVGYTNSGKSALMNRILGMAERDEDTERAVLEKDMLFATLDTFQRRVSFGDNVEFVLVDTVGFVSKLPHGLVKAFRATLEEVTEADLLIHVVDGSRDDCEFQMQVVNETLAELGASGKEAIIAMNKLDLAEALPGFLPDGGFVGRAGAIPVSARRGDNMGLLLDRIKESLSSGFHSVELLIPFDRGDIVSWLSEKTPVTGREYTETGTIVRTSLSAADFMRLAGYELRGAGRARDEN